MATQTIENFNTLDLETLASVEGGLSCDEGMLAVAQHFVMIQLNNLHLR